MTVGSVKLGMLKLSSDFLNEIRKSQKLDVTLVYCFSSANEDMDFRVNENGIRKFWGRVCIPDVPDLKKTILEESHRSSLSIHPRDTKMFQDLKRMFWWPGMKRDVAQFVYSCLTCQKLKIEHKKPSDLMQPLDISEWKWDSISMDFVIGLLRQHKIQLNIDTKQNNQQ